MSKIFHVNKYDVKIYCRLFKSDKKMDEPLLIVSGISHKYIVERGWVYDGRYAESYIRRDEGS